MLVERYMSGAFIGCDTVSAEGCHRLLGVHEKLMFAPPSFAMRGSCFTPNRGQFVAIESYVVSALDAFGFDWGAAHLEVMLTSDGPRLVEINPRLVGAKIPRLLGYALNCSIHRELIGLHLSEPCFDAIAGAPSQIAVLRWIVAHQPGVLEAVDLARLADDFIAGARVRVRAEPVPARLRNVTAPSFATHLPASPPRR